MNKFRPSDLSLCELFVAECQLCWLCTAPPANFIGSTKFEKGEIYSSRFVMNKSWS